MLNRGVNIESALRVRLLVHRTIRPRAFLSDSPIINSIRHQSSWLLMPFQLANHGTTRTTFIQHFVRAFLNRVSLANMRDRFYDKLIVVANILQKQSNVYITLRARQFAQSIDLYHRLYSPSEFRQVFLASLFKRFNLFAFLQSSRALNSLKCFSKRKHILLSLASCSVFSWNSDGIGDKEFEDLVHEFTFFEKLKQEHDRGRLNIENNQIENYQTTSIDQHSFMIVNCLERGNESESLRNWEVVINRPNFNVFRKSVNNSSLYEYKVFGSFFDISAYSFYSVQMDLDFRKEWDNLVLKLSVIEKEQSESRNVNNVHDTGNELIHWIMKYPYPMKSREYVYVRRSRIDNDRKYIVLISRSVPHSPIAETHDNIRVRDYLSQMVIKPHGDDFMKPGFDFMLTYFDNPRASFPSPAYNWMASRGVPDFVEQLHQAAIKLSMTKLKDMKQPDFACRLPESNQTDEESIEITYFNIDFKVKFKDKKFIFEKKNKARDNQGCQQKTSQAKDKDYTPSFESLSIIW